jgi:glycosyltransferase involved in cell wall biosynthesis
LTSVLFLTESFHPVLGGGERHLRALAGALAAAGARTSVVTRRGEEGWPAAEQLDGVGVIRVPPPGPARIGKYRMVPHALAALRRELGRHDVLVVRGTRVLGLPGVLAARVRRRAVVLQPELNGEMSGEVYTWGTALHRPVIRRVVGAGTRLRNVVLRDADALVAMSRAIAEEAVAAGLERARVAHIPHGVDLDRFRPAAPEEKRARRSALGLPAEAVIIIYTGRLLRGKGLETLLDAFAGVAPRHPQAMLLLVGSGAGQSISVEEDLQARVRAAALERQVRFTGRVEDVAPWLQASDVFAFPSEFEALGLSLLEASACALPALGSRTGGIVDAIEEGRSGLLLPSGDREAWRGALDTLLADEERRRRLGARGREVARARFDFRDSVERYRALFAEVSARHRRAG